MNIHQHELLNISYPFSAIWGQERAKRALLLYLVNPAIGGVLVSGPSGSGKSLLLHAASSLARGRRKLSVPANLTTDRLLGSLDIQSTLETGKIVHAPGLLEEADGQLLLVDHMNLMPQTMMKEIVSVLSTGRIHVQREGLSAERNSRFMLLAAMDPEEGIPSPPLLDHFGFYVVMDHIGELETRGEIIRRALQFEGDRPAFRDRYLSAEDALHLRLEAAARSLSGVAVSEEMIQLSASIAHQSGSGSSRAELCLIEGAKAVAAWEGREEVTSDDVREAAEYALPHRMRSAAENQGTSRSTSEEREGEKYTVSSKEEEVIRSQAPVRPHDGHEMNRQHDLSGDSSFDSDLKTGSDKADGQSDGRDEQVLPPDETFSIKPLDLDMKQREFHHEGPGKRNQTRALQQQGRSIGFMNPSNRHKTDVAFDATIRAAAPFQRFRPKRKGLAFVIEPDDLRQKKKESRVGATLLFVVDASGSMAARKRMKAVKGAILSLLQDAYVKRDQIGMIAFRKGQAELILPVTRSVDAASKQLKGIPTGGKTPLAAGLVKGYETLLSEKRKNKGTWPVMIVVSDGRANESFTGLSANPDIWNECLAIARRIGAEGIPSLVLDTEQGYVRLGRAQQLAEALGAEYRMLDHTDDQRLLSTLRSTLS